nr:hypothetical protein GCM10020092_065400 [Actinoplanes digitatis]
MTVPVVGAAAGAGLVWLTGGGVALVAMITCQVAYQLTSTVMVFYRRELWLALVMTPAFLIGVAYLILGAGLRPWSAAVAAGCVVAGFVFAVVIAVRRAGCR